MACGGDIRTSAGSVVVGGMMLLVALCVHGYFEGKSSVCAISMKCRKMI